MTDPVQLKQQKVDELDEAIRRKTKLVIELVNKANQAQAQLEQLLVKIQSAAKEAIDEYMEFVNTLEVVRVKTEEATN